MFIVIIPSLVALIWMIWSIVTVGVLTPTSGNLKTLSGGEYQKVLIAAALAQTAEILLLDEPTTFLDPRHQAEIIRILRKSNRQKGTTLLTVTHDLNSAVIVGERILALKEGRSVFQGSSDEIMSAEILGEIYGQEFDFVIEAMDQHLDDRCCRAKVAVDLEWRVVVE